MLAATSFHARSGRVAQRAFRKLDRGGPVMWRSSGFLLYSLRRLARAAVLAMLLPLMRRLAVLAMSAHAKSAASTA